MQTFSPSPRHRETASSTPQPRRQNAQPIRASTCRPHSKSSNHPWIQHSPNKPGHLTPISKETLPSHSFSPNATRAIEQDGLGGSPYLVSKIIPQREGPRCQRFVEARQRGPSCARTFWKLSTGTRPSRPVGSEYPCCYSALPTELRLVMRILTSSVISRMPSLAGFLGSKQAGFSAM